MRDLQFLLVHASKLDGFLKGAKAPGDVHGSLVCLVEAVKAACAGDGSPADEAEHE